MSTKQNNATVDNVATAANQRKRRAKADPMAAHSAAIVAATKALAMARGVVEDARLDFAIACATAEAAAKNRKAFAEWCETQHSTVDGFPKPITVKFELQWGRIALAEGRDKAKAALDERRAKNAQRKRDKAAEDATTADEDATTADEDRAPSRHLPKPDNAVAALRAIKSKDDRLAAVREILADTGHVVVTPKQAALALKGNATPADVFEAWKGMPASDRAAVFGMIAAAMTSVLNGSK